MRGPTERRAFRVLVVEDELLVAVMLEDMLAELGHHVVATASSVPRAMGMLDGLIFDFAVLDLNLNGEEVYPLADQLAARGVPFMFSTGYAPSRLNESFRDRPLLQKPFQLADLERAIGQVQSRMGSGGLTKTIPS